MASQDLQGGTLDAVETTEAARGFEYYATRGIGILLLLGLALGVTLYFQNAQVHEVLRTIGEGFLTQGFWAAAGVGLLAQIVDGALGMAYGLTSSAFLMSVGVPPAAASASVHLAEVFTTGFSGLSHWKLGNVDKKLFLRLLVPGVLGALLGAVVLSSFDGKVLRPYISGYLLLMGLYILSKAVRQVHIKSEPPTYVAPLAALGGFVDACGGGGWGPVVTTSLIGSGQEPRTTIGSVNAAEFFIAIAGGVSLAVMGGLTVWTTIAGLIFGGLFAAPFAAVLTRFAPTKVLFVVVGLLITGISIYNIVKAFQ